MGNSEFINQIATLHIMRSFQLSLSISLYSFFVLVALYVCWAARLLGRVKRRISRSPLPE